MVRSSHLANNKFLDSFRSCELPLTCFGHGDHLRLAWLHVQRFPRAQAISLVRTAIQNFATHHGLENLYHETITVAWVRLISTHHERTFEEFLAVNRELLGRELLDRFWTREKLMSDEARARWVPPDRAPLPEA